MERMKRPELMPGDYVMILGGIYKGCTALLLELERCSGGIHHCKIEVLEWENVITHLYSDLLKPRWLQKGDMLLYTAANGACTFMVYNLEYLGNQLLVSGRRVMLATQNSRDCTFSMEVLKETFEIIRYNE